MKCVIAAFTAANLFCLLMSGAIADLGTVGQARQGYSLLARSRIVRNELPRFWGQVISS